MQSSRSKAQAKQATPADGAAVAVPTADASRTSRPARSAGRPTGQSAAQVHEPILPAPCTMPVVHGPLNAYGFTVVMEPLRGFHHGEYRIYTVLAV
jgi:hypothetical protein